MDSVRLRVLAITLGLGLAGSSMAGAGPHDGLRWNGPGTCVACHQHQAAAVHESAHYQWQGPAPYSVNGPVLQGKFRSAFNSYCINITGNWGACGGCHVGLGALPEPSVTQSQLENIDCLICHQEQYKRRKVNGVFVPDTAAMTITMDVAVQTVHMPTRATCLQCHARGGGGDNYKRGDISLAHAATTDRTFDVHMATTGGDLTCQQCHTTENHRMAGRGSDLRQTDLDVQMTCSNGTCHPRMVGVASHGSSTIGRHVARVACQTCHVGRTSARNAFDTAASEATEMHRDWATPHVTPTGAIHPLPTLANNIRPLYRFWNRYSENYSLGDVAVVDPGTGFYPTSRPLGSIDDATPSSKLYPFKYKTADQPLDLLRSILVPLDTSVYFATGDLARAASQGMVNMGYDARDPWEMVTTDTLQLLTHEIAPKSRALRCEDCHGPRATQMDLPSLGYTLKAPAATVCTQCHDNERNPGWRDVHEKHVTDKKIECSMCHSFSRPERGLRVGVTRGD